MDLSQNEALALFKSVSKELEDEDLGDATRDILEKLAKQLHERCPYFVNVYLHDRAYGGPEEGGWWYDTMEAQTTYSVGPLPTRVAAEVELRRLQEWVAEENKNRRSDINSVISQGRYVVLIERTPAESGPKTKPTYS